MNAGIGFWVYAMKPKVAVLTGAFMVAGLSLTLIATAAMGEHAQRYDFLNLYTAGLLAREGRLASDLYDLDRLLRDERVLVPETAAVRPFSRPPFYAAVLAPLSFVPYRPAFWVWIALQCGLLAGCWMFAVHRWGIDALAFSFFYLPTALGIAHGQDCVGMLAIVIGAYALAGKRDFAGGAVLGLGLMKFHLLCLWPFALIVSKRWKMLSGFLIAAAIEALFSIWQVGWHGIAKYAALLRSSGLEAFLPSPGMQVSLWGPASWLGLSAPATIAAIACVAVVGLLAVRRSNTEMLFAVTITASLVVVPHVYGYDAAVLLLAIWLALFGGFPDACRYAAAVLGSPLVFAFLLGGPAKRAVPGIALLVFFLLLVWGAWRARRIDIAERVALSLG